MAHLDFFFDLSSPYSYLAATQLPALAARTGATVAWRPMVLFGVFQATGNDMPARVTAKAKYMLADLERWARRYDVPFQMSPYFPLNTITAMRLVIVADREGRAEQAGLAGFRAMWEQGRDLTEPEVLADVARAAELDPEQALAATSDHEVKARLKENGEAALRHGAFGAPALVVGDELFWGNDRLEFVEEALRR